jgi:hypothetical protein
MRLLDRLKARLRQRKHRRAEQARLGREAKLAHEHDVTRRGKNFEGQGG